MIEIRSCVWDGSLITGEVGRIKYLNETAVKILGLADNVRGKYYDDLCAIYDLVDDARINS